MFSIYNEYNLLVIPVRLFVHNVNHKSILIRFFTLTKLSIDIKLYTKNIT